MPARSNPTLFDFEALATGPVVYDLACLWRRRLVETQFRAIPDDWPWFIEGYRSVHAEIGRELPLIPALAALQALWTMGLPAFAWLRLGARVACGC